MKKLISLLITVLVVLPLVCVGVNADVENAADIFVSVSISGDDVLAVAPLHVTDIDTDGNLTIYDALFCTHETYFSGGAAEGFAVSGSGSNASITRLWGVENGGIFGYFLNNASAWSLADPISTGDHLYAFDYQDTARYSDAYTFFDKITVVSEEGEKVLLTLNKVTYNPDFSTKMVPIEGAKITVDDVDTGVVTNAEGKAEISIDVAGDRLISANVSGGYVVPPVCRAKITGVATVNVTIVVTEIKVACEEIEVHDIDKDGALTLGDALYLAHEKFYEGGAAAGYEMGTTQYGLSLKKLWGDDSGNFGYYHNDQSAYNLGALVYDGDYIVAFVYSDTTGYSDTYLYFDNIGEEVEKGDEVTLTLKENGHDINWNPVISPVSGAVITIDGNDTEFVTDENGKVKVSFDEVGRFVLSAKVTGKTIVSPVAVFTVRESGDVTPAPVVNPETGDNIWIGFAVIAVSIASAAAVLTIKNKEYDK